MRNIVIGLLALWSIISLIIIVVWATSPDMKGASECNNNLKKLKEKFAEEKGVWNKDRMALEEQVRQGRTNQSLLLTRMEQLKSQLLALNQSLESCHQQNVSGYCLCILWLLAVEGEYICPWGVLKVLFIVDTVF